MSIGTRIKEERERLGFNQTQFAELVDASKKTQIRWEQEGGAYPDAEALAAWASAGADVLYVLTGVRSNAALTTHLPGREIDVERLARIVEMLDAFAGNAGKRWPSGQLVAVAAEVYNVLVDDPALDEPKVERILKLVVNR